MGQYQIELSVKAQKDLLQIKKRGSKIDMSKVVKLLEELENHPREGTGLPKPLRNKGDAEIWSSRLTKRTSYLQNNFHAIRLQGIEATFCLINSPDLPMRRLSFLVL